MLDDNFAIGIDIENNQRFKNKTLVIDGSFLRSIFTENELEYCFSKGVPHQHLCARFCAKEATIKALFNLNITDISYFDIEIKKNNIGVPYVNINKYKDLIIKISLSHCKEYSCANVLIIKKNNAGVQI